MSTDQPAGHRPERLTRRQRAAVGGVVVLAVAVAASLAATTGRSSAADRWPPAGRSTCTSVQIFTGSVGSPYNQFARVLRDRLRAAPEHFDVDVVETAGSTENIYDLESPEPPRCGLAIAQLNTTVDATEGVNQFDPTRGGRPVAGLRTLGPVHRDLLHVIVRDRPLGPDDHQVDTLTDLCHRTIAAGRPGSGVRQIGDVLLRVGLPDCRPDLDDSSIDDALRRLSGGKVDAVVWAGGAGTRQIRNAIAAGARLRLLDLSEFRAPITKDWNTFYGNREHFYAGEVFGADGLGPADYPGIRPIRTVTIPNGLIARTDTDPVLVRRATAELYRDRGDYEEALWGANPAHRRVPDALSIYEGPLFCYIPLHPAAAEYYLREFRRVPSCGTT
ncbi:TAXI family TRAP transporter solute-binding subunit [Frankia sp. QA3]|uniref:TAXI family TRAP transporter solute-binding subunit n=1 Tax=Frankia sp. QA3 TaxID=710111 RepID=UPI000269C605|nr:TAXI family TRAP transporter solute-binding subunit [Frankia sp. QA3]EIV94421.1 TRAP transporter solute receptor, TAXI family [Frankia sp. QA3]